MATASPIEGAGATAENFKGEVLDPSAFNKNWVRTSSDFQINELGKGIEGPQDSLTYYDMLKLVQ